MRENTDKKTPLGMAETRQGLSLKNLGQCFQKFFSETFYKIMGLKDFVSTLLFYKGFKISFYNKKWFSEIKGKYEYWIFNLLVQSFLFQRAENNLKFNLYKSRFSTTVK